MLVGYQVPNFLIVKIIAGADPPSRDKPIDCGSVARPLNALLRGNKIVLHMSDFQSPTIETFPLAVLKRGKLTDFDFL